MERCWLGNCEKDACALYAEIQLFQNLFQPSMKLVRKVRQGSRLRRHYDRPQTPWARPLASAAGDAAKVAALQRLVARTDPFALSARIDAQLEQVWAFANRGTRQPRATAPKIRQPRGVTPWRGQGATRPPGTAAPGGGHPIRCSHDATRRAWVRVFNGSTGESP